MSDKRTHNLDTNIQSLTPDELNKLFYIAKENAIIFDKLFPGSPLIYMLKTGNVEQAMNLLRQIYNRKS
jgi:hypothetical protein